MEYCYYSWAGATQSSISNFNKVIFKVMNFRIIFFFFLTDEMLQDCRYSIAITLVPPILTFIAKKVHAHCSEPPS